MLVFYGKYIFMLFVRVEVILYFYYWHFLSSWKKDIMKFVIHIVKKMFKTQKNIIGIVTGCRSRDAFRDLFRNLKMLSFQSIYYHIS